MTSKYDLNYVIQDKQRLLDFILGEGEFSTKHPDNDYFRWIELEKYYKSLSDSSANKKMIKQTVLELFTNNDNSVKHISILLGRIMGISEVIPILINLISTGETKNFSRYFEKEVFISAKKLRITEVSRKIGEYYTINKDLFGLLAGISGVSDFEKNIINEDDLWRVECLANYYENCAPHEREDIRQQLVDAVKKHQAFLLLLNVYQKKTNNENFKKLIEELRDKIN